MIEAPFAVKYFPERTAKLSRLASVAARVAAAVDGRILEAHPAPEKALCGYQSLTFQQFEQTTDLCRKVAEALGRRI